MSPPDFLKERFPRLGGQLPRSDFATLPTPARQHEVLFQELPGRISIKYDNLTGSIYGGNKIRKLEYIFPRAAKKHCLRVATFGAAGSNHALATALYAREAGFDCTCFLSHQAKTPLVAATLNLHIRNGTELVRYGGSYGTRVRTLREHLWGRHAWVIPMGGSSWLGTVGFVAAGLELAAQIADGDVPRPDRLYVGAGTMGTAVGLALGLALAGLRTEVHADPQRDRQNLERAYANPNQFEKRRLFPRTDFEFLRPRMKDVVGFLISVLVCGLIIGLLLLLVGIGS